MILFQLILLLGYYLWCNKINIALTRRIVKFFVLAYGIQLAMSIWDPYNYYPISYSTILVFNLQIIFIIIGATAVRYKQFKHFEFPNINITNSLLFLSLFVLAYSFNNYTRMQSYILMEGHSGDVRDYYYDTFFQSYFAILIDRILNALKYSSFGISFILIFSKFKKMNAKELIFVFATIVSVVLEALTSMGRGIILIVLMFSILYMIIQSIYKKKAFKSAIVPLSIFVITGIAFTIIQTTLARYNLDAFGLDLVNDFILKPFATYIYVPILAFDYARFSVFQFDFLFMGAADFASIIDFILTPLIYLDHSFADFSINNIMGAQFSKTFSFPSGNTWNALFTGASNYYLDFGYFGFLIFPYIHGRLLAKFSSGISCPRDLLILGFVFFSSFKHMLASNIQSMDTVFVLLWIFYLTRSKTKVFN